MNRKLFRLVRKKTGIQTFILILVWTIVGMYIVFEVIECNAKMSKWKYVEQLGNDWYYYRATNSSNPNCNLLESLQQKYNCLSMSEVYGTPSEKDSAEVEDVKCYQYSDKAMKAFSYPLKEGKGFSVESPNEVLVSAGVAENHPLGSTMTLHIKNQEGAIGSELQKIPCKVVGVIGQERIIFPEVTNGSLTILQDYFGLSDDFGLYDDCARNSTRMTKKYTFILISPALEIDERCQVPSSGLFFTCSKGELVKIKESSKLEGSIFSCHEIIEKSGLPAYFSPLRWAIRILLWITSVIVLVVWIRGLNKRCKEEIAFFTYIGYPISKISKRCILFAIPLLIISYACSFLGYFIPADIGNVAAFWHFTKQAPLILLVIQLILFILGGVIGYFQTCRTIFVSEHEVPYIEDLPLPDHIVLYYMVRGFSFETAQKQASQLLLQAKIISNKYVPMYRCDFEAQQWYKKFMKGEIE